jgi:hypothetical protein
MRESFVRHEDLVECAAGKDSQCSFRAKRFKELVK